MSRKFHSILCSVLCVMLACLLVPAMAGAAGETRQSELNWGVMMNYRVQEDGTAEIISLDIPDDRYVYTIDIPAEVDGYPVTVIGEGALMNAETVTLPEGIREIKSYGCSTVCLKGTIPSTIRVIGEYAFAGFCRDDGWSPLELPASLQVLGDHAFHDTGFKEVILPDGLQMVGANPFSENHMLVSIIVSSNHPYLAVMDGVLYSKADRRLVCCPVSKKIGEVPEGIRIIGEDAFNGNEGGGTIKLPESLTMIEARAFKNNDYRTSITIPDRVMEIGDEAFRSCNKLSEVRLSRNLESIGAYAFEHTNLSSITLPDSLKHIGLMAFSDTGLQSLTIPANVDRIDGNPASCYKLESISVAGGNTRYQMINGCLYDVKDHILVCGLQSKSYDDFPFVEGTTKVADYALYSVKCKSIRIPDTVQELGRWSFYLTGAETVVLPQGLREIPEGAMGRTHFNKIEIPSSVRVIGKNAFEDCSLKDFVIPEGVTTIEDEAFLNCSMGTVTIPASVTYIGREAFMENTFYRYMRPKAYVTAGSYAETYCIEDHMDYTYQSSSDWLN